MAKKRSRGTYNLPEELINELNALSEELEVPPGQILAAFGFEGIEAYGRGEIDLEELKEQHPRSLKYRYRLNLSKYFKKK